MMWTWTALIRVFTSKYESNVFVTFNRAVRDIHYTVATATPSLFLQTKLS